MYATEQATQSKTAVSWMYHLLFCCYFYIYTSTVFCCETLQYCAKASFTLLLILLDPTSSQSSSSAAISLLFLMSYTTLAVRKAPATKNTITIRRMISLRLRSRRLTSSSVWTEYFKIYLLNFTIYLPSETGLVIRSESSECSLRFTGSPLRVKLTGEWILSSSGVTIMSFESCSVLRITQSLCSSLYPDRQEVWLFLYVFEY